MSHFVATSIVLKKNEITMKGDDNNVVPRKRYTVRIPRTTEEMRTFVKQDILGGCVKPIASANDYFWWWLMRRPTWQRYNYATVTDHELDRLAEYIQEEWDKRKKRRKSALMICDIHGRVINYVKRVNGEYYLTDKPVMMSMYRACYLCNKDGWRITDMQGNKLCFGEIHPVSEIKQ